MARSIKVAIGCFLLGAIGSCGSAPQSAPQSAPPSTSPPTVAPLTRIERSSGAIPIAPQPIAASTGQIIFVPAYSHVYYGDQQDEFLLSITLSIRNTSLTEPIVVRSVRYYNSKGQLIKQYATSAIKLPPLASTEFFIPQTDKSGGSGASFIVEWVSDRQRITAPIVEAMMLSTSFQQGISFTTVGSVIQELKP
ncbi:MAG TPA: DUF3124 domain-containing protein [Coleofasciculaceae cyanobacterium]